MCHDVSREWKDCDHINRNNITAKLLVSNKNKKTQKIENPPYSRILELPPVASNGT